MRILQAIQRFSYTPEDMSTTEIIYNITKNLLKNSNDVTICTTNYHIDTQKKLELERYQVKFIISEILGSIGGLIVTPGLLIELFKLKNYDVIHLHNYRTFQNVVLALYAQVCNIPYVIQAEGSLTTFFQKKYSKILFDYLIGGTMIRNATKVIASSEQEFNQFIKIGVPQEKIFTIPFGININDYTQLPKKGYFKKKYIGSNEEFILFLGRIDKMKGIDLLLSSFSDIIRKGYNVTLVIAGPDNGYLSEVNELIKTLHLEDKIIITGPLYGAEKLAAYQDAEMFVLPSYHDDFGLTVLEALACGTPVIVTNRCGASDVVKNNAGLVIDCERGNLLNGMMTLLDNDDLRLIYSESGKQLVHFQYDWSSVVTLLEECYASCLSEKNN